MASVRDGLSNTLMLGEKYLDSDHYFDGLGSGDNETMYQGFDDDNARPTYSVPMQDQPGYDGGNRVFGSAHAGGFNVALCDGSIRSLSYSIDLSTFQSLGNRQDGQVIDGSQF